MVPRGVEPHAFRRHLLGRRVTAGCGERGPRERTSVRVRGLEPPTSCAQGRRSSQAELHAEMGRGEVESPLADFQSALCPGRVPALTQWRRDSNPLYGRDRPAPFPMATPLNNGRRRVNRTPLSAGFGDQPAYPARLPQEHRRWGSNPRPTASKAAALPLSFSGVASAAGLEPATC